MQLSAMDTKYGIAAYTRDIKFSQDSRLTISDVLKVVCMKTEDITT